MPTSFLKLPLQAVITSAASDGGLSEMQALHTLAAGPLKNLNHITRDRSHRGRSVQKGCWGIFNELTSGLLGALLTQEQSISRQLQSSDKYSRLFIDCQRDPRCVHRFSKIVKNFSFALQRFDSLSVPLFKLLQMLPTILKFLSKLTELGDPDDQKWSIAMLTRLTGEGAYESFIATALCADAMLIGHRMIRQDDRDENNPIMKASEAQL